MIHKTIDLVVPANNVIKKNRMYECHLFQGISGPRSGREVFENFAL
jgi:uncharacterized protein YodC (DUF2158 family)